MTETSTFIIDDREGARFGSQAETMEAVTAEAATTEEADAVEEADTANDRYSGFFGIERRGIDKGMLGGVAMMVIAAVWFFGGLAADIIFFYPPILFVIGLYGLVKGLVKGSLAGGSEPSEDN